MLGLLLVVLLSPWHVRLSGRTSPPQARLEVRLVAGYAPAIRLPLGRGGSDPPRKKRRAKPRSGKRRRPMPRGIGDLVLGLLAAFRFRRLHLSGRVGLPDPADTGVLWGHLTPFVYGLSGPGRVIALAPDFGGPCLEVEGLAELAIHPIRLLRAGLAFAWANRSAA
jgi:hypothetical protein